MLFFYGLFVLLFFIKTTTKPNMFEFSFVVLFWGEKDLKILTT